MLAAEIFVDVVFAAALLAACACLVYLVTLTVLEQYVLRSGRGRRAPAPVSQAQAPRRAASRAQSPMRQRPI
jgi:hypothetical protein